MYGEAGFRGKNLYLRAKHGFTTISLSKKKYVYEMLTYRLSGKEKGPGGVNSKASHVMLSDF